ncbi:hypothetical protein AVEN_259854-1 [Araneus ventricosus]|uniref:BTB domain-containing protein n=1 Tax=Araneus ventricosus TaxID=182803 RepID=A0A4Y2DQY7_ARAVE|nr:hypothetical protein AVEN_259854-1 [Araneus ventricosus]
MVWSDEVGPVRLASGMPVKIVQGAQYMNDVMGSVYGKFTQARNYQKSTEFRGGIWDCNPVKETVPSEPSCLDTSNNLTNKIFSLEEMLACDDEDVTCDDTEMKDDDLVSSQNKAAEFSVNASCIDVKNKRWRSEECDKASLLPCNNSEIKKKKSKKNVSFSDTVVDLEHSSKPAGKMSNCIALDVTAVKDDASCLKETVTVKENERTKNLVILVSENVNDVPIKMEDKESTSDKKNVVKESMKVKKWTKLMSQSCEIDCCDQQPNEQMPVEGRLSKKSLSHERRRTRRAKSNVDISGHETVTKSIANNHKVKNEELMNQSHLENAIPELFQFTESKTEDEADPRSTKKNVKDELKCVADESTNKRNLALEIKETSQTFKKNSLVKDKESNEDRLKNSLLEMFEDSDIVDSITIQLKKLAEQKKKTVDVTEKDKIMLDDEQMDCVSIRHEKSQEEKSVEEQTCHGGKFLSEDESQYESENSAIRNEKVCCPPVCDKPSCNQQSFEKNGKVGKDLLKDMAIKANTDNKSGKVSPTSYQDEKNFSNSVSSSRSDSCSNWRNQCVDVRMKDTQESQPNNASRDHKTRRIENWKKQQANKTDFSSKTEYVEDEMVVIPFYLREPPEPLSRFKGINVDPESIWDACEETTRPSRNSNRIQPQIDYFDWKNASEVEKKIKITSVPRFFDTRTFPHAKSRGEICEDVKHPTPRKIDCTSSGMLSENCRSRSLSRQGNFIRRGLINHRSYERNRSSSAHWRSSLSATSLEHDVFYVVKITSLPDGTIEKLKIFKENFLLEVRENCKLSDIIPSPGKRREIAYSACAVKMFVRCIFSSSYKIPSWITALEAFALAKKFGVDDLKQECEAYFTNYKIPAEQIQQVAACAHQLHAVDALKSSKFFQKVQNFKSFSAQNVYTPQSCTVSCSVLVDPSEFVIPLLSEVNRGLDSCNESDVRNRVFFKSLTHATCLTGIQLKFLTEDIHAELKIICEIFKTKKGGDSAEKLFYQELDTKAKSSIKISFEDEITVKLSEEIEIVVYIEDVLLKICPQLTDNEFVSHGKFHAKFESSKTSERSRKLFCIEKVFYTSQAW